MYPTVYIEHQRVGRERAAALERSDEMFAPIGDVLEVLLRDKPAAYQHKTELQCVVNAGPDHLAHQFVLGFPLRRLISRVSKSQY